MVPSGRAGALVVAVLLVAGACSSDGTKSGSRAVTATTTTPTAAPAAAGPVALEVTEVARGLDTVWSLAFDRAGKLWFTQRGGRLQQLDGPGRNVPGVVEQGEGGLMGLEFDAAGRFYVMHTSSSDNRIVRLATLDAPPDVLVEGIRKAGIHNGGRLRVGPDGALYAGTGDAGDTSLPQRDASRNGKILRIDTATKTVTVFSKGRRNTQGLCFTGAGRFLQTEHGPDRGDEVNEVREGSNGGWPDAVGNGLNNYTPTIAPAGCAVYEAGLIPQWKGSMLFVTLKERDLRRLTFAADGSVASEEVLYDDRYGRLRDVAVAPDGSVYLATSNKDGRGNPSAGDDRILRIAPVAAPATTAPVTTTAPTASNATANGLPTVPRPGEPVAARDNAALARQIEAATAAIADANTAAGDLARQAHILQVAYRALVNEPSRKQATLDLLEPNLRPIVDANVSSGAKLRAMVKQPKTSLPPWRIVAPAPAAELLGYYKEADERFGVPWYYLAAIHLVETRMGRIRGDSEAGAQGPMQFLPATWKQYGEGGDIQSNRDSIFAAARYLKRNGAPGDMRNAVWNYNHDFRYVDAVLAYGDQMSARERDYYGYREWQVYYVTVNGDVWLYEGFDNTEA